MSGEWTGVVTGRAPGKCVSCRFWSEDALSSRWGACGNRLAHPVTDRPYGKLMVQSGYGCEHWEER